jgi:hypothetical protein
MDYDNMTLGMTTPIREITIDRHILGAELYPYSRYL